MTIPNVTSPWWTMFCDEPNADGTRDWSMTRVTVILMAVTYCAVLLMNAENSHLIGWPFASLGAVILMAVPFKMLFTYIQQWFTSSPGQKLLLTMLAKFSGATLDSAAGGTTVTTSVATEDQPDA